jgi:hypothetical protein
MARDLPFPVGYGVTPEIAARVGARWDAARKIVQPAGFIQGADGKVMSSTYSSGPIGRVEPADAVKLIRFCESKRASG